MHEVWHDGGEAPQELVAQVGRAERAVPDPPHRRARVGVGCRNEGREALGFREARRHRGFHEERGLQDVEMLVSATRTNMN